MPLRGSPDAVTNTSSKDGIAPRDIEPRMSGLTGTSRQPRTVSPSSPASDSIVAFGLGGLVGIDGQERHADGVRAGFGQLDVDIVAGRSRAGTGRGPA